MSDSEHGLDPTDDRDMDTPTASRLLGAADRVSVRVNEGTDFRTHALIQGWGVAVLFVYVTTFLLLFTAQGQDGAAGGSPSGIIYTNVLVIAILTLSQLVQGARNRIPISLAGPLRGWKLWLTLVGIILFMAAAGASLFGIELALWVALIVAACVAAPFGVLSVASARRVHKRSARAPLMSPRSPLSKTARVITANLGVYFGVTGALTVAPMVWYSVSSVFLILILLVIMIGWNARWGLPRVGSEWGQRQWMAFGASFTLLFALTLVVVRTSWNTAWVGVIGGILIAMPLALSALPTRHQR